MRNNRFLNGFYPVVGTGNLDKVFDAFNKFTNDTAFDGIENFLNTTTGYHVESTDEGYTVEIPVPGLSKDDVTVTTNENHLVVKNVVGETSSGKWLNKNERTFTIPNGISLKNIKAKVENGLLTISLPFAKKVKTNIVVE
jgi:HSP20 family protein